MLSTSLFSANGTTYPQEAIFGSTFTLNQTALNEFGLPALTGLFDCALPTNPTDRRRIECLDEPDSKPRHRWAYHALCGVLGPICCQIIQASQGRDTTRPPLAGNHIVTQIIKD